MLNFFFVRPGPEFRWPEDALPSGQCPRRHKVFSPVTFGGSMARWADFKQKYRMIVDEIPLYPFDSIGHPSLNLEVVRHYS